LVDAQEARNASKHKKNNNFFIRIHLRHKNQQARKYMNNKFTDNLNKRFRLGIIKQQLLMEGDKVLVALSGGKDSLLLLEMLAESKRYFPFQFELLAVHISIKNIGYSSDIDFLRSFCEELGIIFYLKEFEVDLNKNLKKGKCFICSWHRRKALFVLSRELACNKLALGHHLDDALETLFMNMIYHGSVSSLPYSLNMLGGRLDIIRPLLDFREKELATYAQIREYKKEVKLCPYKDTKRQEINKLLIELEGLGKTAKKNIFRSMDNIFNDYLPHRKK
jgi:tRNA 2-thiocytidine biosynthesis protein TtcA